MSSGGHREVATGAGRVKSRVWEEFHIIIAAARNFLFAFQTSLTFRHRVSSI